MRQVHLFRAIRYAIQPIPRLVKLGTYHALHRAFRTLYASGSPPHPFHSFTMVLIDGGLMVSLKVSAFAVTTPAIITTGTIIHMRINSKTNSRTNRKTRNTGGSSGLIIAVTSAALSSTPVEALNRFVSGQQGNNQQKGSKQVYGDAGCRRRIIKDRRYPVTAYQRSWWASESMHK